MVKIRQEKVDLIANDIPVQEIAQGDDSGSVLVLGWGSTYGAIRTAVRDLIKNGHKVSQAHIRYLNPFPKNLEEVMSKFDQILIPEINSGQLVHLINAKYGTGAIPFNKVQGMPFTSREIKERINELI